MNKSQCTFFGDPNTFSIRYQPGYKYIKGDSSWYFAFLHLRLNGQVIGDPLESCLATTWLGGISRFLDRIKTDELINKEFLNRTDDELFELIWKANQFEEEFEPEYLHLPQLDNSVWSNCHLSLDETTDAYLITTTQIDSDITFLWKGWRYPCPSELRNKLFSLTVSKDVVIKSIEECLKFVNADLSTYTEEKDTTPVYEFYDLLMEQGRNLPVATQRKIACSFCRLTWDILDETGRQALLVAESYAEGNTTPEECMNCHDELQSKLPEEHSPVHIYSPLLWALNEHTSSYPAFYAAAIAGINVIALNRATDEQLLIIVKDHLQNTATNGDEQNSDI